MYNLLVSGKDFFISQNSTAIHLLKPEKNTNLFFPKCWFHADFTAVESVKKHLINKHKKGVDGGTPGMPFLTTTFEHPTIDKVELPLPVSDQRFSMVFLLAKWENAKNQC